MQGRMKTQPQIGSKKKMSKGVIAAIVVIVIAVPSTILIAFALNNTQQTAGIINSRVVLDDNTNHWDQAKVFLTTLSTGGAFDFGQYPDEDQIPFKRAGITSEQIRDIFNVHIPDFTNAYDAQGVYTTKGMVIYTKENNKWLILFYDPASAAPTNSSKAWMYVQNDPSITNVGGYQLLQRILWNLRLAESQYLVMPLEQIGSNDPSMLVHDETVDHWYVALADFTLEKMADRIVVGVSPYEYHVRFYHAPGINFNAIRSAFSVKIPDFSKKVDAQGKLTTKGMLIYAHLGSPDTLTILFYDASYMPSNATNAWYFISITIGGGGEPYGNIEPNLINAVLFKINLRDSA